LNTRLARARPPLLCAAAYHAEHELVHGDARAARTASTT